MERDTGWNDGCGTVPCCERVAEKVPGYRCAAQSRDPHAQATHPRMATYRFFGSLSDQQSRARAIPRFLDRSPQNNHPVFGRFCDQRSYIMVITRFSEW